MKTNPNDLCHPIFEKEESYDYKGNHNGFTASLCGGLTKREYFAAMIFSGIAGSGWSADDKVKFAVAGADALIAELNK